MAMDETKEFDPVAEGWEPVEDAGFIALVGPLHVRASDTAYAFRAEQKHANLIGVVHGGMLMSFADRAMGVAAMNAAEGANAVTIQLEMKFIGAGRLGDWLVVVPTVVQRTRSLVFVRGEVRAGERLVATADGVWKILRRRPETA